MATKSKKKERLKMTDYQFRPFDDSDADYATMVDIRNLLLPHHPATVQEFKDGDAQIRKTEQFLQRYIIEKEGTAIGFGILRTDSVIKKPGRYLVRMGIHPDHFNAELAARALQFLADELAPHHPEVLLAEANTKHPEMMQFWQDQGFEEKMRYPESVLDLAEFDAGPFDLQMIEVERAKIRIVDWQTLQNILPEWKHAWYDFDCEVIPDIPSPEALQAPPFEHFQAFLDGPLFKERRFWFALHGYTVVGMTGLMMFKGNPKILGTLLSAVRGAYRRKGIATALKVTAIEWARSQGYVQIWTDNYEKNPMLTLNKILGFKEAYSWVEYHQAWADLTR